MHVNYGFDDLLWVLWKYDMARDKYANLAPFSFKDLYCFNCICFEDEMLMGTSKGYLYLYDFYTNSYSKIAVFDSTKIGTFNDIIKYILLSGRTNAYRIESKGDIYESGFKNPYIWYKVRRSEFPEWFFGSSWTYYNNFIFIRESSLSEFDNIKAESIYFEFNLEDKTLKRKKVAKRKCQIF
ncbi:unnamed protein product [Blepharisma stoltei]|uniref:Uncharacterized protein n=1 Tax=Blepharisma stoltei TaxID=1481888 RepID=A0AAU9K533_9CILI|nr:unnamed protein product [Blepharisma stoltei]